MTFLLMYNLKFSESASKKFVRPPKSGQNQIRESTVAPVCFCEKQAKFIFTEFGLLKDYK